MEISIEKFQEFINKRKSKRHEEIKLRILDLQTKRNYNIAIKSPECVIKKIDKELKRLNKKLLNGRI